MYFICDILLSLVLFHFLLHQMSNYHCSLISRWQQRYLKHFQMRFGIRCFIPLQQFCAVQTCLIVALITGSTKVFKRPLKYVWDTVSAAVCACVRNAWRVGSHVCRCAVSGCAHVHVCAQHFLMLLQVYTLSLSVEALQESERRTWRPCDLQRSRDFKFYANTCMAEQQRNTLPDYEGVEPRCITLITCHLLTLYFTSSLTEELLFHPKSALTQIHMASCRNITSCESGVSI